MVTCAEEERYMIPPTGEVERDMIVTDFDKSFLTPLFLAGGSMHDRSNWCTFFFLLILVVCFRAFIISPKLQSVG